MLAFAGLVVAISDWEAPFEKRDSKGNAIVERNTEFSIMIMMLTALALIALSFQHYFALNYINYKDPVAFHKQVMIKKAEMGLTTGSSKITQNYLSRPMGLT